MSVFFLDICVTDAIILVDREQGGAVNIQDQGVQVYSLFKLSELLNILKDANKITAEMVEAVAKFIASNQIAAPKIDTVKEGKCIESLPKP